MSEQLEKILIGSLGNNFVQKVIIRETKATWKFWGRIPYKCKKVQRTSCAISCHLRQLSSRHEKLQIGFEYQNWEGLIQEYPPGPSQAGSLEVKPYVSIWDRYLEFPAVS
jgi:hypothetical protein